jgi:hypothetical protein
MPSGFQQVDIMKEFEPVYAIKKLLEINKSRK